jgi:translation initiation factor IF-3
VRVVGAKGDQVGVMEREKAIEMAFDNDMDLVEVSPNADPPVCRIMDFGKYLFEQNKKAHAGRKKQKQIHVKEVKFRPGTEENDYQVKLQKLVRFLQHGDKAKVTLRFRGREMAHQELGVKLLKRVENDLEELAIVEQFPKMEARQLVMLMTPKKK